MTQKFNADVKITTGRSTVFFRCKVVTHSDWFTLLPSDWRINFNSSFWQVSINKVNEFPCCGLSLLPKKKLLLPIPPTFPIKKMSNHKIVQKACFMDMSRTAPQALSTKAYAFIH